MKKITCNSPVIITFAAASFAVLLLGYITRGRSTTLLFSVYRASMLDPLTWLRMLLHVLGHSGYAHYIGNMLLLLVVGPGLEEKYGSRRILLLFFLTAFVTGVLQFLLFPGSALLGASGIVFMLIILASFTGVKNGQIPLTALIVAVLYLGGEVVDGIMLRDNISQFTHIAGGGCGLAAGFALRGRGSR